MSLPLFPARGRNRALYLAAWLPVAGFLAWMLHSALGTSWKEAGIVALPAAGLLALICLAARYPVRALPAERTPFLRLLGAHLVGAALLTAVWLGALALLLGTIARAAGSTFLRTDLPRQIPLLAGFGVLVYLLAVTFHQLLFVSERTREAERRAIEHELQAREAELKLLRAQVDPHFLFNSLNSIAGLIHSDPPLARAVCLRLGSFLRSALNLGPLNLVPLEDELALAHDYLAVEQARFGSRLHLSEELAPETLSFAVPPLILQPLLENAVRHGIANLIEGGEVRLEARLAGSQLRLAVENDLDPETVSRGGGLGLANVRRRLEATYGDQAVLALRQTERRFRAELTLPAAASDRIPGSPSGAGAGGM